jgi:Zn-dependent metalloprotease
MGPLWPHFRLYGLKEDCCKSQSLIKLHFIFFLNSYMKKLFALIIIGLPIGVFAQSYRGTAAAEKVNAARTVYYNERTNTPAYVQFRTEQQPRVQELATWLRLNMKMADNESVSLLSTNKPDVLGMIKHRYQQTYNGVPVEWAILNVHEKDGKIVSLNGDIHSEMRVVNTATMSPADAIAWAKKHVGAQQYKWENKAGEAMLKKHLGNEDFSFEPTTQLVVMPVQAEGQTVFKYAYRTDIYASLPKEDRWDVYTDAQTGALIEKIGKICATDVPGTAVTKYHGTHSITTDSVAPANYVLRQNDRRGLGIAIEARNCKQQDEFNSTSFTDTDNIWNNVNPQRDEAATDAYLGAEATFDYYWDKFSRNSFDDNGSKMLMYLHYDVNYFNAFWNGSYTVFGDGNGQPLTSVDVVGHEFTHAVTQYTAGLNYRSESGALNESFSDIFGTAIEFSKLNNPSWEVGVGNFRLRDMADPNAFGNPDTYGGLNWTKTIGCIPDQNNDYCGVHNNSGVQNFWFYLLSVGGSGTNDLGESYQVTGIGIDKAAEIAYRNLSEYLTPNSNYNDARFFSIESVIELYGELSPENEAVQNAWHAVGVGRPYSVLPVSDFYVDNFVCQPNKTVRFVSQSGNARSYLWNFGDGSTSNSMNPTHSYANTGMYTVTLITTNASGSDTLVRTNIINIYNEQPKNTSCAANTSTPLGVVGILRVQFGAIDKSSQGSGFEDGYQDFTCARAYINPSKAYPVTITTSPTVSQYTRIWIDYNNDGFFTSNELAFSTDGLKETHSGTITAPADAVLDQPLRMRVISSRATGNTPSDPCSTVKNGQIEDYVVYVTNNFVGVNTQKQTLFSLFPNPAQHTVSFKVETVSAFRVSVMDVMGRVVLTKDLVNGESLDVSSLPKGLYAVKVQADGQESVQKLVKE